MKIIQNNIEINYQKLKNITLKKVEYSYDFQVQQKHRIIAKHPESINAFYTSNCALDISHPQIKDFITVKQNSNRLTKFNLSVLISDRFMNAVEKNQMWQLCFPDIEYSGYKEQWDGDLQGWIKNKKPVIVYQEFPARQLWDLIMLSTYNRNQPGVLFYDTINDLNPVNYCQTIITTNPCITGDTLIAVADGRNAVSIKQLAQYGKDIPVHCIDKNGDFDIQYMRNPRITGYNQDVYKVNLDDGSSIKCTGNHKFILSDGIVKEALQLNEGDSLYLVEKRATALQQLFKKSNSKSQKYYVLYNNLGKHIFEHKLIYQKIKKIKMQYGNVIHHIDFNGRNNSISNLKVMTRKQHNILHSQNMFGDKNPMNRWYKSASEQEKQLYHDNMSKAVGGQKNWKYCGINNQQLYKIILQYVKNQLKKPISKGSYQIFAKKNKLPFWEGFNKYRGKLTLLLNKVNIECDYTVYDKPQVQGQYINYLELKNNSDLNVTFDSNTNIIYVHKKCQICGKEFAVNYNQRQISICSEECATKYKQDNENKSVQGFNDGVLNAKTIRMEKKRKIDNFFVSYIEKNLEIPKPDIIYNFLKENDIKDFRSIQEPSYQTYINTKCKSLGINEKIQTNGLNKHQQYRKNKAKLLLDNGLFFNHKVINVQYVGKEDVYNGTVDECHNFGIIIDIANDCKGIVKLSYIMTQQCGQIPSPSNVCNLNNLNLPKFLNENNQFDFDQFERVIKLAVCFLDNICDISYVPLQEYYQKIEDKRRIGLGVMGLGSLLMMMGLKFGSHEAIEFVDKLFKFKAQIELLTSSFLGKTKGSFKAFDKQKYFTTKWWYELPISYKVKRQIENIGQMRNCVRSTVPPNGNSSIFSGQVSNGIQPVFMKQYTRWVVMTPEEIQELDVKIPNPQLSEWFETDIFKFQQRGNEQILRGQIDGITYQIDKNRGIVKPMQIIDYGYNYILQNNLSKAGVVEINQLSVDDHLNMLAASAKYIDQNQSKTINIPNQYTYQNFKNVYINAWKKKIKGITTYRDGTMTVVLESNKSVEEYQSQLQKMFKESNGNVIFQDVKIPDKSFALQYKIKDKNKKKWYITVSFADKQLTKPFAMFIRTNNRQTNQVTDLVIQSMEELLFQMGIKQQLVQSQRQKYQGQPNVDKIGRSISMALRHNIPLVKIVQILDKNSDGLSTLLFHIKKVLSQYIKDGTKIQNKKCSECGSESILYQGGCAVCSNCGNSRCG